MNKDKDMYAVVLAGGSGTRFWPASRKARPKQFLSIQSDKTLLQQTIERVSPMIEGQNTYIVTGAAYKKEVINQLKAFKIPSSNILLEPSGKNTAPAIAWAASIIHQNNPNAVMAILPSDHLISKGRKFLNILSRAIKLARKDYLVTFGIVPTRPETGYGYLKIKKEKNKKGAVIIVEQFTEKPNMKRAKEFIRKKKYLWNSGMFVWKTAVILDEFEKYLPSVACVFKNNSSQRFVLSNWGKLPSISIDYGILEKSRKVAAVEAKDIGWSDLGSWESLKELMAKDKRGNSFKGHVMASDCQNTLIQGENRLIAAIGLENLIIVDTPDALLICHAQQSQKVKEIVDLLKKRKDSCL